MPILLSLVYHLQKNMIINPIELCNPSVVADPGGALPSVSPPQKKKPLDFDICLAEHDPGPP